MHLNGLLRRRLFTALDGHDHQTMADCDTPAASFRDIASDVEGTARSTLSAASLILLGLLGTTVVNVQAQDPPVGQSQQRLGIDKTVKLWTEMGNKVPVCWTTNGYAREKQIVRQAVIDTWQYYADIEFTGWGNCPTTGEEQLVRVNVMPQDDKNNGAGGSAQLGTLALSKAGDPPQVNMSFNPDGSADVQRVEYVGVHEFGHVLGFPHEQDMPGNVEGPAKCKTAGPDPNGVPVTAYDRNSVMNYCNADGNNQGRLTDIDILGVRSVYGTRPQFSRSAVILLGNGEVWRYNGRPCTEKDCPGWILINKDPRIKNITASDSRLFARQGTGELWVWDGRTPCTGTACPGWTLIDSNTRSRQIVAAGTTLFQLQVDGRVWRWDGRTACSASACPGWTLINMDARIAALAASEERLFARLATGEIWAWDGRTPCAGTACPGWSLIDSNTRSVQIAAAGDRLYQLHGDGKMWAWDGRTACSSTACPGWALINTDPRVKTMAATKTALFARQTTGQLWQWDGHTPCTSTACPGWSLIDSNTRSQQIVAGGDTLFQVHVGGNIWRRDGNARCDANGCSGWTLIDRDARTIDIQAFMLVPQPSRLSSGTLF